MFNLPVSAIKALDSLLAHIQEETVEPIEDSIKGARKNFKAGNYLALAMFFIILGISSILSQYFSDNFFLQAMSYFAMAFLCIVTFVTIIWRLSLIHI